jgi:molecular chaperone GrpE (heat shock protein)
MKEVFEKAGVEVTKENRKMLDEKIHQIVGVEYKNCSKTWKTVKERLHENKEFFIHQLHESVK